MNSVMIPFQSTQAINRPDKIGSSRAPVIPCHQHDPVQSGQNGAAATGRPSVIETGGGAYTGPQLKYCTVGQLSVNFRLAAPHSDCRRKWCPGLNIADNRVRRLVESPALQFVRTRWQNQSPMQISQWCRSRVPGNADVHWDGWLCHAPV